MNLKQAEAEIERLFTCEDAPATALYPTGEEFVEIGIDGIMGEDRFPGFATSETAAASAWVAAVLRYATGKKGTLYWRERPAIAAFDVFLDNSLHYPDFPHGKHFCARRVFKVYSRLLITDRPIVWGLDCSQPAFAA